MSKSPIQSDKTASPRNANGRGSIYKITTKSGQIRYRAAVHDALGKRRCKNFTRKSLAEDWLASQRQSRDQGISTYASNPKMTVEQFLNSWLQIHKGSIRHATFKSYQKAIKNHIVPAIGHVAVASLNGKAVEALYTDLVARGYKSGTLNGVHATLSCAFNDGVRHGEISRNPMSQIKKPRIKPIARKPIPQSELQKIYSEAAKNPFDLALLDIHSISGLRNGEIRGLLWSDVDFDNGTLLVERQVQVGESGKLIFCPVKQGSIRTIPLSKSQLKSLRDHKRHQSLNKANWNQDEGLIFPGRNGGKLQPKSHWHRFRRLTRRAQVGDYMPSATRKNAFTEMAKITDPRTLKEFSGHSQLSTLMGNYLYTTSESVRNAVELVEGSRLPRVINNSPQG